MLVKLMLVVVAAAALAALSVSAADKTPAPKVWPDVLLIDDFESGLSKWESQGSGKLEAGSETPSGKQCLQWTSEDDSVGQIVFKNLSREEIDFSQYDLLMFRLKVDGRPIWNLNPIVQQYPSVYGFRGLYYSVDTLYPYGKWFTFSQDLTRWENAWPDGFSATNQEFRFEVHQLAAAGATKIQIDEIKLLKNPLGLKPSYHGRWSAMPDGSQLTRFTVELKNKKDKPVTARLALDAENPGTVKLFKVAIPSEPIMLLPGEVRSVVVDMSIDSKTLKDAAPWYGEMARLAVTMDEAPGLLLQSELVAGCRPEKVGHPSILCDAKRMAELRAQYAKPETRASMLPELLAMVRAGEQALAHVLEYPALAATGKTVDPVSGGKLERVNVPSAPYDVYQDKISGRSYSGPLYDAGMKGWLQKHMANSLKAKELGVAYLLTGRPEFGQAAARILRDYITSYPELPIIAYEQGSPVGSACSGSTRIGGTFMRERVWLTNLAVALDCARPGKFLNDKELDDIAVKVFAPSADNMMDHKVGVMNLQMMIQSAALYAALAAEDTGTAARAVYSTHGVLRLFEYGYLRDGNWWENPSYQGVMNLCAFPALAVCMRNGMVKWEDKHGEWLTAFYRMAGPDLFTPELGTGNGSGPGLNDTAAHVFAPMSTDPRIAWLAYNHKNSAAVGHYSDIYAMAILEAPNQRSPRTRRSAQSPPRRSTCPTTAASPCEFPRPTPMLICITDAR